MSHWPPSFRIKRHPRAKYARLRIDPRNGLEILLPKGMPDCFAEDLIHQRRQWIEKHLQEAPQAEILPDRLHLPALEMRVGLSYEDLGRYLYRQSAQMLRISSNKPALALQHWLKDLARERFPEWLQQLADAHDFSYERCRIGLQKSRWGSCSSRGTISLNAALLLLERPLVEHVMLHELCHTRHMHHGPAFYSLLASTDPGHRNHSLDLRAAWRGLPHWLFERD